MAITNSVARADDYLFTHAHHHAPWGNRLKCSTMVTKPPCMSAVVQAGGTLKLNNFNFLHRPPEPLFAVVKTCNIARLQLLNSTTPNPSPAAAPWQDAVLLIQLMYEGFILCLLMCACHEMLSISSVLPPLNSSSHFLFQTQIAVTVNSEAQ